MVIFNSYVNVLPEDSQYLQRSGPCFLPGAVILPGRFQLLSLGFCWGFPSSKVFSVRRDQHSLVGEVDSYGGRQPSQQIIELFHGEKCQVTLVTGVTLGWIQDSTKD